MYSIGEFSKITNLSVKALRHYHDKGVLLPSHIDHSSGYRYYSKQDIEKARAITHLKEMMFSLAEITHILQEFEDESEILQFLEEKQQEILARAKKLKDISRSMNKIIQREKEIREMNYSNEHSITKKEIDEQLVLTMRWKGRYQDVGKVFSKLYRAVGRHSNGAPYNLYYDGEHKEENADIETCVPTKKEVRGEGCELKTVPSWQCLSLIHKGPYEELGHSYQKVFDYLKNNNHEAVLPFREIYIKGPGMLLKGNPKNYITEIQVRFK